MTSVDLCQCTSMTEFTLDTPCARFTSLPQDGVRAIQQHKRCMEVITESAWSRMEFEHAWSRIKFEVELPPPIRCAVAPLAANLLGLRQTASNMSFLDIFRSTQRGARKCLVFNHRTFVARVMF